MTECNDVFARLSEYLDQELPDDLCEQIEKHIAGCAPCVQFGESLKKSVEACRRLSSGADSPPISDSQREQLREAYERMRASLNL